MFRLVEEYQGSGTTLKDFCAEKDINIGTFNYWRKKKAASSAGGFIKLDSPLTSKHDLELVYPNGVRLRMNGPDLALVKNLLELY